MARTETIKSPAPGRDAPRTTPAENPADAESAVPRSVFWQSRIQNAQNAWQFNFPEILQSARQDADEKILGWFGPPEIPLSACTSPKELLGCHVAAAGLMEAVLKHGSFTTYHFLSGVGGQGVGRSQDEVRTYLESLRVDPDRIAAFSIADNVQYLSRAKYYAVHKPGPDLIHMSRLRHVLGGHLFPITGMTHTISYDDMMHIWLELLLADLLPCDTVVCTSTVAVKTLETILAELGDRLAGRMNCERPAFKGRLELIPLGVDAEYWTADGDKAKARRLLGLAQEPCIILCPGRFSVHDKMDLAPLLIAFRRLADKRPDRRMQLILTGDLPAYRWSHPGTYAGRVRAIVHNLGLTEMVRIEISPALAVMRLLFQASDIFVSPSDNLQETFGLTVLQAMACGLPAVVSDWDGYKDTVVHGETGFRARTFWAPCEKNISDLSSCRSRWTNHLYLAQSVAVDLDQMEEYLDVLIDNPSLRTRLGHAARKRVEQLYAWPVIVRRYEQLWDECHDILSRMSQEDLAQADRSDVFHPSFFTRFSHFPSTLLDDRSLVSMTGVGSDLMSQSDILNSMMCCDDMRYVLCAPLFAQIGRRMESVGTISLGDLVRDTVKALPAPTELVMRHILWLIKYGALRVIDVAGM